VAGCRWRQLWGLSLCIYNAAGRNKRHEYQYRSTTVHAMLLCWYEINCADVSMFPAGSQCSVARGAEVSLRPVIPVERGGAGEFAAPKHGRIKMRGTDQTIGSFV
jgi:hypothetical protein